MSTCLRIVTSDDSEAISALVQDSFQKLAAADWDDEAQQVFIANASTESMAKALQSAVYAASEFSDGQPTGFILFPKPSLLGMLFVNPNRLGQGIARRLWEAARAHIESVYPDVKTIELNSTPYAVNIYRALGFVPISTEFVVDGCRATRMACWLRARSLGAEVPKLRG
jgi:predicted GNAT family N-acyltransferase